MCVLKWTGLKWRRHIVSYMRLLTETVLSRRWLVGERYSEWRRDHLWQWPADLFPHFIRQTLKKVIIFVLVPYVLEWIVTKCHSPAGFDNRNTLFFRLGSQGQGISLSDGLSPCLFSWTPVIFISHEDTLGLFCLSELLIEELVRFDAVLF